MPVYEYICQKCNRKFSLLQSIRASESGTKCPGCSSGEVKKIISPFSCTKSIGGSISDAMPSQGAGGGG
ncbi:MAG: zinc ribbon domain-containing protein [Nitrospirae bacterium]|nr:zinc ribbon domain-containing protein [Nitrospirota bacterium]